MRVEQLDPLASSQRSTSRPSRCSPTGRSTAVSRGDLGPQQLEQHLGVAHRTELGAEPLQLARAAPRPTRARAATGTCGGRSAAGGSRPGPGGPARDRRRGGRPGRASSSRCTEERSRRGRRRVPASRGVSSSGGTTSGGATARMPSARTIFGVGSGGSGARAFEPRDERVGELDRRVLASSTSSSRNRLVIRPSVEHRHLVVDDLRDLLAAGVGRARCAAGGSSAARRRGPTPCGPTRARGRPPRPAAHSGSPGKVCSPRTSSGPSLGAGSFTVQPSGCR